MERIGEYLVRRLVGEGGMGKVYEAEERLSHRRVALKVLRPELAKSEEGRRLFLNEMKILAHLDHDNVVRCLACAEADGQLLMALEYLEGRTLREHLNEHGPLGWEEAVDITVQIASALAAAHRQEPPIVHRDLKPENVMLLDDGSVKVMDFGIAKVLQALSKNTTHSVGTLQYMSPEQIDAANVDARSDLYCLGLSLFEMLAGKPPFQSSSPRELLNLQCTAPPPPLPEEVRRSLPKEVERLLQELLEKRPDDRPGSAADVLHELGPLAPAGAAGRDKTAAMPVPRAEPPSAEEPAKPSAKADDSEEHSSVAEERASEERSKSDPPERERSDTRARAEETLASREVPARAGLVVVVLLSVIAGLVTYLVRASGTDDDDREQPARSEEWRDERAP